MTLRSMLPALLLLPSLAHAASSNLDDLDSDGKKAAKKETKKRGDEQEVIREIERGFYLKSAVGSTTYLSNFSGILAPGTALSLAMGQDFIDHDRSSMAWELAFSQGVHNGLAWDDPSRPALPPNQAIQGDTRTFMGLANLEYSIYPTRRLGVGLRAGGGIMLAPLLIFDGAYQDVQNQIGTNFPANDDPHPVGFGGGTFEYYTKLSHFSIGADVDFMYAVSFDMGLTGQGYLKYSF